MLLCYSNSISAPIGVYMKLLVINGPNINFLGIREKAVYGKEDFWYLLNLLNQKAEAENITITTYQSNCEGEIIDRLQDAYSDGTQGIIINPGAYTHYSYAIRDALASLDVPIIEVHISNVHKREEFRHVSVTAPVCTGQIVGLGLNGYLLAVDALIDRLRE
jgi:3-dehydroquinate dehydratase-2